MVLFMNYTYTRVHNVNTFQLMWAVSGLFEKLTPQSCDLSCHIYYNISLSNSTVPDAPVDCNCTIVYNQSSGLLQSISSTWNTVVVSHAYVTFVGSNTKNQDQFFMHITRNKYCMLCMSLNWFLIIMGFSLPFQREFK